MFILKFSVKNRDPPIFITAFFFGAWVGLLAAILVGFLMGLLFAYIVISLNGNQVMTGLAIWLFGIGLAFFMFKSFPARGLIEGISRTPVPYLSEIPVLGAVFFSHDILLYAALMCQHCLTC